MPEPLATLFGGSGAAEYASPGVLLVRLVAAAILGWLVAWVYRRTRPAEAGLDGFATTLVLLAVLIAAVTQIIGDNIARAFSLVGALSIVRFRTVVRETQDTAFVIFAVVVGMAVGANDYWVGAIGLVVTGVVAFLMHRGRRVQEVPGASASRLSLRVALGLDLGRLAAEVLERHAAPCELAVLETARQGLALEAVYRLRLRPGVMPEALLRELNQWEGVQHVRIARDEPAAGGQ